MTAIEILEQVYRHLALVRRDGDRLRLESDFGPLPQEVINLCRRHKAELLSYLAFEEEADRLVVQSTERVAKVWKQGIDLPDWWSTFEDRLREAYQKQDLDLVRQVLEAREQYAWAVISKALSPKKAT